MKLDRRGFAPFWHGTCEFPRFRRVTEAVTAGTTQEIKMDWEHMEGDHWNRVGTDLQSRWPKLTADDLESIAGSREHLLGRLQALYGLTDRRAESELRNWERHREPIELPH